MTDHTELRKLAEAATQGEWKWDGNVSDYDPYNESPWLTDAKDSYPPILGGQIKCANPANAAYIAVANPAAILSLLDRLEKAEKAMEQQKDEWLSWQEKREQLEKDAARYQWLRERYTAVDFYWEESGQQALIFTADDFPVATASCDETIDRAMDASK